MTMTTDTDLRELKDLIAANHAAATQQTAVLSQQIAATAALSQRVEIGFAQVDTKFAGVDTKLAEMNGNSQALDQKLSGDIKALDQKVTGIDDRLKSQEIKLTQMDANQRVITFPSWQ